ncbi:hypothetical protein BDD12DRAFT_839335 [Trichophaea hybrida]|nr:hypothetical protein BDD12DRAFT_839335 [Trichophaea hybrida]
MNKRSGSFMTAHCGFTTRYLIYSHTQRHWNILIKCPIGRTFGVRPSPRISAEVKIRFYCTNRTRSQNIISSQLMRFSKGACINDHLKGFQNEWIRLHDRCTTQLINLKNASLTKSNRAQTVFLLTSIHISINIIIDNLLSRIPILRSIQSHL